MNDILLGIVQAIFVYLLLWWVAFPLTLHWNVPDFWVRQPWQRGGKTVYLKKDAPGRIARKFIAASLIALVATAIVFPIVKSGYVSLPFNWMDERLQQHYQK